ncbi:MAG: TonB-dependent receptor [Flavobacteriaceae bacterium]|nr:TonB-dependent receptor [Flavobacteriaceae bacterium]
MKNIIWIFFCLITLGVYGQENQFKTESILVRGNCNTCKITIENAVATEPSATGNWNIQTKELIVKFDPKKTNFNKIMRKVAEAGHDNQRYTAEDKDYRSLSTCCLYDRVTPWERITESTGTHLTENENTHNHAHDHAQHVENEINTQTEASEIKDEPVVVAVEEEETESAEDEENYFDDTITLTATQMRGNKAATALDGKSIALTYNIDAGELLKAACCNLSESFETNATVDVNYANAVTGTKQIKMLGLDQKYTLITKELLPDIRGLATAYGMNFIPGRWISGIQLTKGGSTVTNGYESISGQINTELFKTHSKGKTALNLFGDLNSRFEGNVVHTDTINRIWSQSVLLHGNATVNRIDTNDDNFMDQPIGRQINATYLLNANDLDNSGYATHFGLSFVDDRRLSGDMDFHADTDKLTNNRYGAGIDISRFQAWNKTGYIYKEKPWQSIGWMNQYTYHEQKSYFGLTPYNGIQNTFYSNLIWESILGDLRHKYKAGASFMYDRFDEDYRSDSYKRNETVPGAFVEYSYIGEKLTAVIGSRVDFHNLAGTQFTPRANIKYDITPSTTLRASAGRGFRTANVFAESQSYLASNRDVVIMGSNGNIYGLDPEIAWNYGVSLHQEFRVFDRKSSIIADFFRTDFENQIIPDLENPQEIRFYNMDGGSYANAFQIQWDFQPIRRVDARLAYKNYTTQGNYLSGKKELPFTPQHRAFLNLSYSTFKKANGSQWSFDSTLQWVGEQRIPDTSSNPAEFQLPDYSDAYFVLNGQIARSLNSKLRVYLGAENILSYTQENPILDVRNPFGNYFDGGMVWAPIMPINFYFGLDIDL